MRKTKTLVERTTSEIIEMALTIFGSKGYQATNLQDIADALGITRTPMYYHFKNKLVLYEEAIDQYLQKKQADFTAIFEADQDIFEKIRADLVHCSKRGIVELTLFMGVDDTPALKNVKKKRKESYQFVYDLKTTAVKKAVSNGELRQDTDIIEFVNHFYILFYGFIGMSQAPFHKLSIDDNMKLIDTILKGMIIKYSAKMW